MGKTLDIENILAPDSIALEIGNKFLSWDTLKAPRKAVWKEMQEYIYSTSTATTSNASLPWKNKTTLPKLCQIRDNIYANYMATLFPKSDFVEWYGADESEQTKEKTEALEAYTKYILSEPSNREALAKAVLDYIDYGMPFMTVEWRDDTVAGGNGYKTGYIGPQFVRFSPYDIVFDPTAPSFQQSPKIVRSVISIGELAKLIESESIQDHQKEMEEAFKYALDLRARVSTSTGAYTERNALYRIDGFSNYTQYLSSNLVELLYFYGDMYDVQKKKLYKNAVIIVLDRHKLLCIKESPSDLAYSDIQTVSWRPRQDNLWAMSPLENLVGMQYRIDHLENLKADVFDLIAAPPIMIKGLIEDFEWGPLARIYVEEDGDIKILAPEGNVLSANTEIAQYEGKMEEFAGSPKEAAGFRTPGEKTAYEVQRLENAANRIFYSKTRHFEEFFLERLINQALEMTRRKLDQRISVRVEDPENNATNFLKLTKDDLAGLGTMKPVAARNFADKAEKVQNVNNFFASVLGQDPEIKAHFSTVALARMFEELLDLEHYGVVQPYVRLFEQQEAQKYNNVGQENIAAQAEIPAGITPDG